MLPYAVKDGRESGHSKGGGGPRAGPVNKPAAIGWVETGAFTIDAPALHRADRFSLFCHCFNAQNPLII